MKAPVSPPATPRPEVDLDATAELPVLDPAEMELEEPEQAADAAHSTTDTWILPPGAGMAPIHPADTAAPPLPVGSAAPARRGGTADGAAQREFETNIQTTVAKLRDAEQLAARQAEQLRELEKSRALAHAAQRAAEESAESLRAELTRREAAGVQHTAELESATRARSLAERHAAIVADELVRARELSSNLSEQVMQLQQRLAQHQTVLSGELTREREQQQARTAQAQAHSARLIEDLHLERARNARCLESLQTLEIRRQIAESVAIDLQRETDVWHSTEAELRGRLGGRDSRVRELETELERRAALIRDLEQQRGALEARIAQQSVREHAPTRLEEVLAVERQRVTELEKQHTAAVGREALEEEKTHGDALHPEPTADGAGRLLIHSDDGREVVHVLGRKTSIGRTPDNDVQIDGRHISRHHAVILAGPATTLIEDLNSTNGVLVNGKRITRQVLQDGDQVTIGRTMYRFAVRRAGEPR